VAVLTVDVGGTPLTLACQRGGHAAPRRVGNKHTGQGAEESSVRAELMVVPVVTAPILSATYATLKAMFALGAQKTCQGDLFNNNGYYIVCSAKITGELRETADSWIVSFTLYEVGNALTGVTSPDETLVLTTHTPAVDPPADYPAAEDAVLSGSTGGGCFYTLLGVSPAECSLPGPCAITYSATAERVWILPPVSATTLSGIPTGIFVSKGSEGGAAFAYQSSKLVIYLCRGGTEVTDAVEGPVDSDWPAGTFFGGVIGFTFPAIAWDVEDGDQIRVELWSRISLNPGESDPTPDPEDLPAYNLGRQTICYGGGTGVVFPGIIELLP